MYEVKLIFHVNVHARRSIVKFHNMRYKIIIIPSLLQHAYLGLRVSLYSISLLIKITQFQETVRKLKTIARKNIKAQITKAGTIILLRSSIGAMNLYRQSLQEKQDLDGYIRNLLTVKVKSRLLIGGKVVKINTSRNVIVRKIIIEFQW